MMKRRTFIKTSVITTSLFPLIGLKTSMTGCETPAKTAAVEAPFVINSGIGGNTSGDILARIDRDCLAHRPDLTLLMAGGNDCMNTGSLTSLPAYEQNMRTIISKILRVKSQIILMSILPAYEPYLYTRHDKKKYAPQGYIGRKVEVNNMIRQLADEYQLIFLDMHHIFETAGNIGTDSGSLLQNEANSNKTDGVHPTEDGYRVMAVALYECMVEKQLPCKRIVCLGDSITAGSYPDYLKKLLRY